MTDITSLSDKELGYLILKELVGGEPTVERVMYWYRLEQQKQRQQIRLATVEGQRQ